MRTYVAVLECQVRTASSKEDVLLKMKLLLLLLLILLRALIILMPHLRSLNFSDRNIDYWTPFLTGLRSGVRGASRMPCECE
jgi:hypothetical protein